MGLFDRKPKRTAFETLLGRALAIRKELDQFDRPEANKLSREAFLNDALAVARTSLDRLAELDDILAEDGGRTLPNASAFVRRLERFIREGTATRTPREVSRLRFAMSEGLAGELSTLKSSPHELFALAVKRTADKSPASFGQVGNWDEHQAHLAALREELTNVYQRLGEVATTDDLTIATGPPCSMCGRNLRATYKISGGTISPGPDGPQQLVTWLLAQGVDLS